MIAPLSIDLSTAAAKTAFPLPADNSYAKWRLVKLESQEGDIKDGHAVEGLIGPNGKALTQIWEYDLVDPTPSQDGGTIEPGKPGAKIFERIQLYAKSDAKDKAWFVKKICTRVDALLGTADSDNKKGKPARPEFFNGAEDPTPALAAALLGSVLLARMGINTYEGSTRAEFKQVEFPADRGA